MKKIAVIMSIYKNDSCKYLMESIDSILNQNFSDFDLFLQCDGPIGEKCRHYIYSIKDNRFHFRERQNNYGLARSLNELLTQEVLPKKYEYVARMDADDVCVDDRFEKQILFLEKNFDVDVLGGFINETNMDGDFIQEVTYPTEHESMKDFFGKRNPLAHMTVMFRRSYFEKAGLYPEDTNLDEDTMFWFEGFKNSCVFANIPEVIVDVRVDSKFYSRRNGFFKSFSDFKNRLKVIKGLRLSFVNYIWAFGRFVFMSIPFPELTKLLYKKIRK